MSRKIIATIAAILNISLLIVFINASGEPKEETVYISKAVAPLSASASDPNIAPMNIELPETELYSDDEIDLLALVTMAEAEGECELGKRLVIDTVLNRVDSNHFPDTVYDVVYQPNHFSSMWNGRVDRCSVKQDIRDLVLEEIKCRTNNDVIFFNAKKYSKYGSPLFQVGNHCFSSYD